MRVRKKEGINLLHAKGQYLFPEIGWGIDNEMLFARNHIEAAAPAPVFRIR